jgi:hypothetical protein
MIHGLRPQWSNLFFPFNPYARIVRQSSGNRQALSDLGIAQPSVVNPTPAGATPPTAPQQSLNEEDPSQPPQIASTMSDFVTAARVGQVWQAANGSFLHLMPQFKFTGQDNNRLVFEGSQWRTADNSQRLPTQANTLQATDFPLTRRRDMRAVTASLKFADMIGQIPDTSQEDTAVLDADDARTFARMLKRIGFTDGVNLVYPEISLYQYGNLRNPTTNETLFFVGEPESPQDGTFGLAMISENDVREIMANQDNNWFTHMGITREVLEHPIPEPLTPFIHALAEMVDKVDRIWNFLEVLHYYRPRIEQTHTAELKFADMATVRQFPFDVGDEVHVVYDTDAWREAITVNDETDAFLSSDVSFDDLVSATGRIIAIVDDGLYSIRFDTTDVQRLLEGWVFTDKELEHVDSRLRLQADMANVVDPYPPTNAEVWSNVDELETFTRDGETLVHVMPYHGQTYEIETQEVSGKGIVLNADEPAKKYMYPTIAAMLQFAAAPDHQGEYTWEQFRRSVHVGQVWQTANSLIRVDRLLNNYQIRRESRYIRFIGAWTGNGPRALRALMPQKGGRFLNSTGPWSVSRRFAPFLLIREDIREGVPSTGIPQEIEAPAAPNAQDMPSSMPPPDAVPAVTSEPHVMALTSMGGLYFRADAIGITAPESDEPYIPTPGQPGEGPFNIGDYVIVMSSEDEHFEDLYAAHIRGRDAAGVYSLEDEQGEYHYELEDHLQRMDDYNAGRGPELRANLTGLRLTADAIGLSDTAQVEQAYMALGQWLGHHRHDKFGQPAFNVKTYRLEIPDDVRARMSESSIDFEIQRFTTDYTQEFIEATIAKYPWINRMFFSGGNDGWLEVELNYGGVLDTAIPSMDRAVPAQDFVEDWINDLRDSSTDTTTEDLTQEAITEMTTCLTQLKTLEQEVRESLRVYISMLRSDEFWADKE